MAKHIYLIEPFKSNGSGEPITDEEMVVYYNDDVDDPDNEVDEDEVAHVRAMNPDIGTTYR